MNQNTSIATTLFKSCSPATMPGSPAFGAGTLQFPRGSTANADREFPAGRAYPFVRCPLDSLADEVVDAEQALPRDKVGSGGLQDLISPKEKFLHLEKQLWRMFGSRLHEHKLVDFAVQQISASPDGASITKVAAAGIYPKASD